MPSDSDGTSGRPSQAHLRRQPQHRTRAELLLQHGRGAVVRFEQRGPQRQRVGRLAVGVARRPLLGSLRHDVRQPFEHRHRRVAVLERRRVEQRLERRAGLPAAARRAIELRLPEVPAADQRQDVPGPRIERHERRLELADGRNGAGRPRPPAPPIACSSWTNVVRTSQSGGWSPPNSSRNRWRRNSLA